MKGFSLSRSAERREGGGKLALHKRLSSQPEKRRGALCGTHGVHGPQGYLTAWCALCLCAVPSACGSARSGTAEPRERSCADPSRARRPLEARGPKQWAAAGAAGGAASPRRCALVHVVQRETSGGLGIARIARGACATLCIRESLACVGCERRAPPQCPGSASLVPRVGLAVWKGGGSFGDAPG